MTAWSVVMLLLAGAALGPQALGVVSTRLVSFLDPVTTMAVAIVGAATGLRVETAREAMAWRSVAARARVLLTLLIVIATTSVARVYWLDHERLTSLTTIFVGICAAFSNDSEKSMIERGVMLLFAAYVVAAFWHSSAAQIAFHVLSVVGLATSVAWAGSLLVRQTDSDREQHVFIVGSLLLVGGIAAYVSLSALMTGFIAGVVWTVIDTTARIRTTRVVDYLEHPAVAMLLLIAGAELTFSFDVLILSAVYVICRVAIAIIVGRPMVASVFAVVMAVDVAHAWVRSDSAILLLGVVVIGTIVTNGLALVAPGREAVS